MLVAVEELRQGPEQRPLYGQVVKGRYYLFRKPNGCTGTLPPTRRDITRRSSRPSSPTMDSLPAQVQRYHDWAYDPLGLVSQISQLVRLAERWLVEGEGPPLLDRLVIDRCIRALPPGAKHWATGNQTRTVNNLVELLENHQVTQRLCGGVVPPPGGGASRTKRRGRTTGTQCFPDPPGPVPAYPGQNPGYRRGPPPMTPGEDWRCFTCGQKGHLARHCPGAEDVSMPTVRPEGRRRSLSPHHLLVP